MINLRQASLVTLLVGGLLSGCGTVPDDLAKPVQMSCIYLPEAISQTGRYGLLNIAGETRLERGPYISERQDDKGTYYRAPPGGVRAFRIDDPVHSTTIRDGGIYIPNDSNDVPRIYEYLSTANASAQLPPEGMDCSGLGYTKDPTTSKIAVIRVGTNGAIDDADRDLIGRAATSGTYYNPTAYGGLVGLIIVNSIVGNIDWSWDLQDPAFIAKLRKFAAGKVPVKEISPQAMEPQ